MQWSQEDRRVRPRSRRGPVIAALVVLALAVAAGCGRPINVASLAPSDIAVLDRAANFPHQVYRIEPGDTLQIRFTFHKDMNQDVLVQPDGKITTPHVGELAVAGLTTAELERLLVEKTSDRLRRPEVVVGVVKYSDKTVYIGGEVLRPGVVPYRRGLTPLQAVIAVGGFRDTARLDSVVIVRTASDGGVISRKLDLAEVVHDGAKEPIALAPHDVVFVPRTPIADANLWVRQHITDLIPIFRGVGASMPLIP